MSTAVSHLSLSAIVHDLVALTKPRINAMVIITTAGGMWLAPGDVSFLFAFASLLSIAGVVAAANTLNCWLERDSDRYMQRTADRPLPAGRLDPRVALGLGVCLAAVSLPAVTLLTNVTTGLLGAIALLSYVAVYTPLKPRSSTAVLVGAVPGALPPLMGWTAVTGRLDPPGLVLFAILFLWQVPHFIAISSYRREEYDRAGLKTVPTVKGETVARVYALVYAAAVVPTSLLLVPLGIAGSGYMLVATILGLGFTALCAGWLMRPTTDRRVSRLVFLASLVHLTLLFGALILNGG